ncbi:DUF2750 domain-containing protein [Ureibacillus chungkukjangi]|uniref:Uncharacterized protein DUF2750 n=1 Tax=Ureibacillus chungkukjangi TaxID=1202712 RepID=A0A318U7F0_9BACL|nr:DUF2750 domain-containing protein [Ureibacillus chungkukjangi]PYF07879.1 uncharacterized protein DUF2750 [Ureibacillus chungkukjangi]
MNPKEFESVIKQSPKIRYEYFIKKVVDFEEVWGLYNEGWATSKDDDGNMLIPFFPKKEFADYCAINEWDVYKATSIDLDEFIEEWLEDMNNDGIKPSIFPTHQDSALVEISILSKDLKNELENY